MKKAVFFLFAGLLVSCNKQLDETMYVFNIVDDSIVVYHNDMSYVGTVKLQGQLDSLLVDDNF